MEQYKRILIVRLSAIGDVVNVLPALSVLRKNYPSSYIAWLVEDRAKDILCDNPEINEIFVFPRKKWSKGIRSPLTFIKTIKEAIVFFKRLRNNNFDLIIDFHGNLKSGLMTMLSGKCPKLGFDRKSCKEYNYIFTNMHVHLESKRIHRVDKNLELLKFLNINTSGSNPQIFIPQQDKRSVENFLQQNCDNKKPLIVIHPGTSAFGEYKRWSARNFAILASKLKEELEASVIFTCGPTDTEVIKEIRTHMDNNKMISFCSNLKQLTEIINHADIFISGDTGPMHIASVMKRPVVAIFGPKDPVIYGPYTHGKDLSKTGKETPYGLNAVPKVIRKELPCSPCRKRKCSHVACINTISYNEIFAAVSELLSVQNRLYTQCDHK